MVQTNLQPAKLHAAPSSSPQPRAHPCGARTLSLAGRPSVDRLLLKRSWRANTLKTDSTQSLGSGSSRKLSTDDGTSSPAKPAITKAVGAAAVPDIVGTISTRLPEVLNVAVPEDVLTEFEHKLEADIKTVGVTLSAIMGVIIFWRGVWSLLDHYIGDSVFGDICCSVVGLAIVLYIRLSGAKLASFWPPS